MCSGISSLGSATRPSGKSGKSRTSSIDAAYRRAAGGTVRAPMADLYVQRDQPPGVPPLHLTGERTLPDVPEENYWYRRHLAVYEWIARRAHGRLKYTGGNVSFQRDMIETWTGDVDCVVFLQTIEHVRDPDAVLARLRDLIGPEGVAYISTPNVLTLAPEGQDRSGNPWHVHEYRPDEYRALCSRHFGRVELLGLFHAGKLRVHELAIAHAGWDAIHPRLRLTKPFYERFT